MWYKSVAQPLCRYCGKPIAKHTHTVWFGQNMERRDTHSTMRTEKPKTREEAQRLVNEAIVSISWSYNWEPDDDDPSKDRRTRDHIHKVTTWDGESYADEFFCNGEHARAFGYACARNGSLSMTAYREAMARRAG